MSSPVNRAGWAVRVQIFLTQVMLWFCLELLRKGSAKGGGILMRVEVHLVHWLTPEFRNPETQPHFVRSGGRYYCTAFHWESPTKEFFTHGIW